MIGLLLTSSLLLALFSLGAAALVAPGSLMRYHFVPLAFGLNAGARRAVTRAAGASLVLLSSWLSLKFFVIGA